MTKLTDMYRALDTETLQVSGLKGASYTLQTDGQEIRTFRRDQLTEGVNLARYDTPMMQQADKVLELVSHRVDLRFYGWRAIQVPLRNDKTPELKQAVSNLLEILNGEQDDLISQAQAVAQPRPHHYELTVALW